MTSWKNNEYQMKILLKKKRIEWKRIYKYSMPSTLQKEVKSHNVGFEKRAGNV